VKIVKLFAIAFLICFQTHSALAFFYQPAPTYRGPGVRFSTFSVSILKDFADSGRDHSYENYYTDTYFTEDKPGVAQDFPGWEGTHCMFQYLDPHQPKVGKGNYFVKRDMVRPAMYPEGLYYREIYFGWTREIRILCQGPQKKMMNKDFINRLMKGYIRVN
jgi:hypothetical protein